MTTSKTPLADLVQTHLQRIKQHLLRLDLTALARRTGFLVRLPRKIPMASWVQGVVAVAGETVLTLERVASVISLAAQVPYTKQALQKRLGPKLEQFLAQVATTLFETVSLPVKAGGWLAAFGRVLLHDSTVEALPALLAKVFPGPGNGRKRRYAALKIQFVCDLLISKVLHLSLSGFTRNDQAAAPDLLRFLRAGDLVLRDLGYFVLKVLDQIRLANAFFLSRYRHGVKVFDAATGEELDLARLLRPGQWLDRPVLLGQTEKVPARLLAQPVAEALANERRRQANTNRDRRLNPSPQKLYLLAWNLWVTNVPRSVWPPKAFQPLYRLRWRVEMIFKAWKSHLGLRQLNCRSADLVRLSVMTKLLFCIIVYRLCDALELLGPPGRDVSLLRLAHILGQCACWVALIFLEITLEQWLKWQLQHHAFYERRKDRKNFYELFKKVGLSLG